MRFFADNETVGARLPAIGCEAVVKKAGLTIAGKSFRLYREQAHSYRFGAWLGLLGSDKNKEFEP
jgi:hypothetical protein